MLIISFIYFSHSNRYLHHITNANNSDSASQLEHYCSCLSMCIYCCLTCGVKDAHWTSARVVLGYFHPLTQDEWAGTRWAWLAGRAALSLLGCDHEPWPTVGVGTLDHGAVNLSWPPCGPPCKRSQVEEICITTSFYEFNTSTLLSFPGQLLHRSDHCIDSAVCLPVLVGGSFALAAAKAAMSTQRPAANIL